MALTLSSLLLLAATLGASEPAAPATPATPAIAPAETPALPPATVTAEAPKSASNPARARALTTFQTRHLALRPELQWSGGGVTVIDSGWGMRRAHWGFSTAEVIQHPPSADASWAVFQGPRRLSVPEFLREVGDTAAHERLTTRLHSLKRSSTIFHTIAGIGLAGTLVGTFSLSGAEDLQEYRMWSATTLISTGVLLTGAIAGGYSNSKASRLTKDFETIPFDSTRVAVDAYNEKLGAELGLTPEQVYEVIYGARP